MSDKKTFKIYKLLNESIDEKEKNIYNLIEKIIWKVNRDIREKKWTTEFIKPSKSKNIKENINGESLEVIFYKAEHILEDMFTNFIPLDLLWWTKINKTEIIFICFVIIWNEVYFFSSGHTFSYFLKYVDEDFSLNIASKLITWNIKNEKSVSIMWETLTSDLIFRWLKTISKFDNLWKVIKWFTWEISKEKSKKIVDLLIAKNETRFCEVGNSFSLKMSINFNTTLKLIYDLNKLYMEWKQSDDYKDFQMLEKINTRFSNNKEIKEKLDLDVVNIILNYYKDPSKNSLENFELVNSNDFSSFIECSLFEIEYKWEKKQIEWILKLKEIIDFIREKEPTIKTKETLLNILQWDVSLYWYNPDWDLKIDPSKKNFFLYIITEFFSSDSKKYFLINWDYYYVKEEFIKILDEDLIKEFKNKDLFLNSKIDWLVKEWKKNWKWKYIEWEYNKTYLNETDFIVLDKVLYNWIEFCDLVYKDNMDSYLFHNKQWFEGDMRILSEQIIVSAVTLSENLKLWNDKVFIDYYNSLCNKKWKSKPMNDIWEQSNKTTYQQFLNYFKKQNLGFVLAFTYNKDLISIFKKWNKSDFDKLSLIAKYELLTLIKKMRAIWIPLYITQIKKI